MYSKNFLNKLFQEKVIEKFARITRLDINDYPLEEITGKITSGSVNLDSKSNVHRTCNLSMIILNSSDAISSWGLTSRFKLEIGIMNNIDSNYPNKIWFNYGVFIITSFNFSQSGAQKTLSISGKDKMCLLNGEYGGKFHAQIDFGKEEIVETGNDGTKIITTNKVPIRTIIIKMLQQYGNESLHNIIIEDLEDYGLQLLEYRGEGDLYLVRRFDQEYYSNIYFQTYAQETTCYLKINGTVVERTLSTLPSYDQLLSDNFIINNDDSVKITFYRPSNWDAVPKKDCYSVAKLSYGETAGYHQIKLVYPGELIANIGESVTSVLDKIKNMLGDFEYFYNENGQFIFRRQRSYTGVAWSPLVSDDQEYHINEGLAISSSSDFVFKDNKMITQLSINPNWSSLVNDFSVWGERDGISGGKIPIHIRYAIDTKPNYYKSVTFTEQDLKIYNQFSDVKVKKDNYIQNSTVYCSSDYTNPPSGAKIVDWREIIYQMARDWYRGNYLDDFTYRLQTNNPSFINGKSGYEQYYPDLMSFWRQLYDPDVPSDFRQINVNQGTIEYKTNSNLMDKNGKALKSSNGVTLQTLTWLSQLDSSNNSIIYYQLKNNSEYYTNSLNMENSLVQKNLPVGYKSGLYYLWNKQKVYYYKDKIIGFENDKGDSYICVKSNFGLYGPNKEKITTAYGKNNFWYYKVNIGYSDFNKTDFYIKNSSGNFEKANKDYDEKATYYKRTLNLCAYESDYDQDGFSKEIKESPDKLNFWFDFLDVQDAALDNVSVKRIGDKLYSQKDQNMKSIYYKQTPNLIYKLSNEKFDVADMKTGFIYINLPIENKNLFSISSKGKSAIEVIEELIYNKTYVQEPVNITIIPNYDLKVGSRITLINKDFNINDDFLIDKISISFDYSGLMQLTLNKAPERLL